MDAQGTPLPQLIVQVETRVANVPDGEMTATIQAELVKMDLLPEEHIVDTGYVDAALLVSSQHQGISLLGPVLADTSWQAQEDKGFDQKHFVIDWMAQQATCPQGQTSSRVSTRGARMEIVFATEVCAACPVRGDCTRWQTTGRVLHLRPQAEHEALQRRRQEQPTPELRERYTTRAGIEAMISQQALQYEAWGYDAHAMMGCIRRICSIF